jgi:NaMN:DMB phosphoribosyltransferase
MTDDTGDVDGEFEQIPVFETPSFGGISSVLQWWATCTSSSRVAELPEATLGRNLILVCDPDETPSATAAAVAGLLTGRDAPATTTSFIDSDGLIDHDLWMAHCAATRDEMARLREFRDDAPAMRAAVNDEFGTLVDRLAAVPDGTGQLVDGATAAGAALLAYEIEPAMLATIRPLQSGEMAVSAIVWEYLRIEPVLPVRSNLCAGELSPAAAALINNLIEIAAAD